MTRPAHHNRTILRLGGADCRKFLQGLITNDITKLEEGPLYAALLTPQGKYLADFFLLAEDEKILLDCHADLAKSLAQRLAMYRLRSDVTIEPTDLQVTLGDGPAPTGAWADPRHPDLGWRSLGPETGPLPEGHEITRIRVGAPESLRDLIPNESYILEMNFEAMNGVDFRKGCYVGQEVTARMKHKTSLRKGLAHITVSAPVAAGTPIQSEGKEVGQITSVVGRDALAYLRFDRISDAMQAGEAQVEMVTRFGA